MIRVLGFDNWSRGKHHFEQLVNAFAARGMELTLVHLGSWGNDPDQPDEEMYRSLRVRDIRYYKSNSYLKLLDTERPDGVLLFSTDTFAHRALLRYCGKRGIPTLHAYHGIVNAQKVVAGSMYKTSLGAQILYVLEKIPKALRYVWPCYIGSLIRTGAPLADWTRFLSDIFEGARGKTSTVSAADARTDLCAVYIDADKSHAIGKYAFRPGQVSAVGNPDLVRFGFTPDDAAACLGNVQDKSEVMYIDTGLIFTGWVFSSHADFIAHMLDTAAAVAAKGCQLVFKPHPDHERAGVVKKLQEAGIEICSTEEFVPRLKRCRAAIVETSTAAIVPALMGLPLLLANYGRLSSLNFGDVLTSYPRARHLRNLDELDAALADEQAQLDVSRVRHWITENSGPLPAEEMPDRVAKLFEALVKHR
jgi:hypothetical protein